LTSRSHELIEQIAAAGDPDSRTALIRRVPEVFGTSQHKDIYSSIAARVYVPTLAPDFAYIHWVPSYELPPIDRAYADAVTLTAGFSQVGVDTLATILTRVPHTLRIFRLLLGLTPQELAASTERLANASCSQGLTTARVKAIEEGARCDERTAWCLANLIDLAMSADLFPPPPTQDVRSKIDKPDTSDGWVTVRRLATDGVPLSMFLHQRHYGGAFRQLLDATSTRRGDILEEAVSELLTSHGVSFIRTGSSNQVEIATRFGLTVRPAPDFVVFDSTNSIKAIIECKAANDGGTARDKAGRFGTLRAEATRLGGLPLVAVLAGLGWKRTADALGPVIRDTDGRVFTLATLGDIMKTAPFSSLGSGPITPARRA
jgi:hypothetical protein